MEWLNYHHLLYFWTVAKHGSIVRASEELRLAHPTISGQIHRLEEVLGEKLFVRRGRNLVLTEAGGSRSATPTRSSRSGRSSSTRSRGGPAAQPLRLVVGDRRRASRRRSCSGSSSRRSASANRSASSAARTSRSRSSWPSSRSIASTSCSPTAPPGPASPCARSATRSASAGPRSSPRPKLAAKLRRKFPRSLDGAPFLLPGRALDGSPHARAVVRRRRHPTAHRRRDRRQRARVGVRRGRPRRLRGADGDRGRDPPPLPRARRRPLEASASSSTPSRSSARSSTRRWPPSARQHARTSFRDHAWRARAANRFFR